MTKLTPAMAKDRPSHGFVVVSPRPVDAIGGALRDVFGHDRALPRDMACLLDRLDRSIGHRQAG
jgi:hypothetical protein